MVSSETNRQLVEALSTDMATGHRLARPRPRPMLWLAMVGAVALALTMVATAELAGSASLRHPRPVGCGDGLCAHRRARGSGHEVVTCFAVANPACPNL
jgi:hypothetical protein